ncbi:MAG: hypothetical protein ACI4TK_03015 [Agathobacter sp.]
MNTTFDLNYKPVTERDVIEILRHKDNYISVIHRKMYTISMDLRNTNEIIWSVSLPSQQMSEMPRRKGVIKDLEDTYEKYRIVLEQRKRDYQSMVFDLIEEEMSIVRVWMCYLALGEPYATILDKVYVQKQLYSATELESDMAHSTFERKRQEGIKLIIKYYDSGKSASELKELEKEPGMKKNGSAKKDDTGAHQMSLSDWIEELNKEE